MMRALQIAPSVKLPRLALLLVAIAGLGLGGCDDDGGDPKIQIGANPVLPAPRQYLIPPIRIAKVVARPEAVSSCLEMASAQRAYRLQLGLLGHLGSIRAVPRGA